MSVTLTQTRVRPDDIDYEVIQVGVNYLSGRLLVRIRFTNGDTQDLVYEGAKLNALRNRLPQFNGLRAALEADIAANEPGLGGNAS